MNPWSSVWHIKIKRSLTDTDRIWKVNSFSFLRAIFIPSLQTDRRTWTGGVVVHGLRLNPCATRVPQVNILTFFSKLFLSRLFSFIRGGPRVGNRSVCHKKKRSYNKAPFSCVPSSVHVPILLLPQHRITSIVRYGFQKVQSESGNHKGLRGVMCWGPDI